MELTVIAYKADGVKILIVNFISALIAYMTIAIIIYSVSAIIGMSHLSADYIGEYRPIGPTFRGRISAV